MSHPSDLGTYNLSLFTPAAANSYSASAKYKEVYERVVGKPYQGQRTMLADDNPPMESVETVEGEVVEARD